MPIFAFYVLRSFNSPCCGRFSSPGYLKITSHLEAELHTGGSALTLDLFQDIV
jgi:hypothetical protein